MLRLLRRHWWVIALRGLLAVIFGLLALIWPEITVQVLVIIFGAYAVVDGLFTAIAAVRGRERCPGWGVMLLGGVLGIIVGVLTFIWPQITAVVLLTFIAIYGIVTGIIEIVNAIQLRKQLEGEWMLGLSGLLSVIFGVLLIVWPASGLVAVTWLIGAYALILGVMLIGLGFRLRGLYQTAQQAI